MAPKSSTVARVSRKASAPGGMRLRKKPKTPMAKAMSVAMGTAQPRALAPTRVVPLRSMYTPCGRVRALSGDARACTRTVRAHHGDDHASQRAQARQDGFADGGQGAVDELLFYVDADDEEEDGHEALVDPLPQGQVQAQGGGAHVRLPEVQPVVGGCAVGQVQGQHGGRQQRDAAPARCALKGRCQGTPTGRGESSRWRTVQGSINIKPSFLMGRRHTRRRQACGGHWSWCCLVTAPSRGPRR